jgi:adenosylcobinamide amidohydrolase
MAEASVTVREERDVLVLSFSPDVPVLSWAVLNGGFRRADHIVNHHVAEDDADFARDPTAWLQGKTQSLGLGGTVVGMATAVDMAFLAQISFSDAAKEIFCFATVGCNNAMTAGDAVLFKDDRTATPHTVNMILLVRPGLREEAMVEAVQIATEGRVRALFEMGVVSRQSGLPATGTGTDCIAIASLGEGAARYCGKHTALGSTIGFAAYTAVKMGVQRGRGGKP